MRSRSTVIALCATKGGVGKTTLATALAVSAADEGHRVGLLDYDPQESLSGWHERRGSPTNPKLLDGDATPAVMRRHEAAGWRYIILDTPPALMDYVEAAVEVADLVLIPCRSSAYDILAIGAVVEACTGAGKPFAFVVNCCQPNAKITASAIAVLGKAGPVLATTVGNRLCYAAAATVGKSGPEVERDGAAGREVAALWSEVKAAAAKRRS